MSNSKTAVGQMKRETDQDGVILPGPKPGPPKVAPTVPKSSTQRRHRIVLGSFLAAVLAPTVAAALYLWVIAADQYASYVSFSIRSEQSNSPMEMLGGLAALTGASNTPDAEVLYALFHSQDLVARVDQRLDLRGMWSKPSMDPLYAYSAPGTIEDLTSYWNDMVSVTLNSGTGILDIRVLAFDPADATAIASAVYAEGTATINHLSEIAREDALRYAREDLDEAVERLRTARAAVTRFRNTNQIVDPSMDTMGQMGLINTLQTELASAMVGLDLLRETTRAEDTRILQAERRIAVIENRIAEERQNLGMGGDAASGAVFADIVGEFERLTVDRQFSEQSYTAALANFNSAQAESGRQSRYLAAHVAPTIAEKSMFPQRGMILLLFSMFLILLWAVVVLVGYSLKDRR